MPVLRTRLSSAALAGVALGAAAVAAVRAIPAHLDEHPPVAAPEGATFLVAADGTRLFHAMDAPADARAVVWIVQGLDADGRPALPTLRAALRRAGVGVATMHPRGTGFSDGPRGDVDDFRKILEDERAFAHALRARFPGIPVVLLAHGSGAPFAVELAAALADEVHFDGVVLVNPAPAGLEGGAGTGARALATYAAYLLLRPGTPVVDARGDPLRLQGDGGGDAERVRDDPLRVPRVSVRLSLGLRGLAGRWIEHARRARAPLLVISGKDGEGAGPSPGDELARAWGGTRAEVRHVWGGRGAALVEASADAVVAFVMRGCTDPFG